LLSLDESTNKSVLDDLDVIVLSFFVPSDVFGDINRTDNTVENVPFENPVENVPVENQTNDFTNRSVLDDLNKPSKSTLDVLSELDVNVLSFFCYF
jgi:hypothetical protein